MKKEEDAVRAEVVIDGRPAVLEKMYINASEGLTGPKVHYIELYGKDLQTGEERRKRSCRSSRGAASTGPGHRTRGKRIWSIPGIPV